MRTNVLAAKQMNIKDGTEPFANEIAISNSVRIRAALSSCVLISDRPSIEGGVMLRYGQRGHEAFVECYNDGEIGYTLTKSGRSIASHDLKAEGLNENDLFAAVKGYLDHSR